MESFHTLIAPVLAASDGRCFHCWEPVRAWKGVERMKTGREGAIVARLSPDTHPDAERVQIELMRQAPAWRKLLLVGQMVETCRLLAVSGLRQRYPGETPEWLRMRLAALTLGQEEAVRVYGQAPEEASGATGTDCRHPVGSGRT